MNNVNGTPAASHRIASDDDASALRWAGCRSSRDVDSMATSRAGADTLSRSIESSCRLVMASQPLINDEDPAAEVTTVCVVRQPSDHRIRDSGAAAHQENVIGGDDVVGEDHPRCQII